MPIRSPKNRSDMNGFPRYLHLMRKWIDLPPVWLLVFVVIAWMQGRYFSLGLEFGTTWARFLGGVLVGGGIILMVLAADEMRRQRTTIVPRQQATRLVTTGIFSRTRNPIYLGDLMVLSGLILTWSAVLSLALVPIFLWVIEKRFVLPEEEHLSRTFGAEYARYCERVRRWV
ncbi:methyltransferase family protein [Pseudooceanicola sp. LIPI14-2-Ac024]|uniref:methyltransferase family protein n=1 Tax=Pseudooceanicola sp. LIPI14-2-Ac024 TaxID=3344875 RepID=UPI0035D027B1